MGNFRSYSLNEFAGDSFLFKRIFLFEVVGKRWNSRSTVENFIIRLVRHFLHVFRGNQIRWLDKHSSDPFMTHHSNWIKFEFWTQEKKSLFTKLKNKWDSQTVFKRYFFIKLNSSQNHFQIVKTEFSSGLSGRQVYFFPWLGAKPAHIEKYCDQLYGTF